MTISFSQRCSCGAVQTRTVGSTGTSWSCDNCGLSYFLASTST